MDDYEINLETLLILPFGNGKSKIYEIDREFIIKFYINMSLFVKLTELKIHLH